MEEDKVLNASTSEDGEGRQDAPVQNVYLIAASIIAAGAMIATAVLFNNSRRAAPGGGAAAVGAVTKITRVEGDLSDDDPFLGNPKAPVTVVEFSDFQCPFCRKLWREVLPGLKKKYIDSGKVKFVYRDFPLSAIHELAEKYAEAGECADEQGRFWQMHDKIFGMQEKLGAGTATSFSAKDINKWAREIGLDGVSFDSCLDSGKYAEEVKKDLLAGQAAGVTGTPATFVNGRFISGAVPLEQFESVIEEELKK